MSATACAVSDDELFLALALMWLLALPFGAVLGIGVWELCRPLRRSRERGEILQFRGRP